MDKDIKFILNGLQDNLPDDSEPVENHSEETKSYSEKSSEQFRTVHNHSEEVQNETNTIPNSSEEHHRTAPNCSDEDSEYTITVREAARIFEDAGVFRTERALTNWCNRNSRGVTKLDCCYRESQRRYYITPKSIDGAIKEEQEKALHRGVQNTKPFSAEAEQLSGQIRKEAQSNSEEKQNHSEQTAKPFRTVPHHSEEMRNETKNIPKRSAGYTENLSYEYENNKERSDIDAPLGKKENDDQKELQMENYEMRVQLEGQKYLIRKFDELVDGERERHEKEKLALVDRLTDARYQIGSLEEKLLQLEAPGDDIRTVEVTSV